MNYQTDTAIFDDEQKIHLFKEIGHNIAMLRQNKELGRHDLCQMANITVSTLARIENGESFSGCSLMNLIIALQADVGDVIPLHSQLRMETNSERFENLTNALDSYEMNSLFRIIEMYVNSVKRKGGMTWMARQN